MKPQGKSPEGQTQIKGKTFTYESYLRIQERGKTYTIVLSWKGKLITTRWRKITEIYRKIYMKL